MAPPAASRNQPPPSARGHLEGAQVARRHSPSDPAPSGDIRLPPAAATSERRPRRMAGDRGRDGESTCLDETAQKCVASSCLPFSSPCTWSSTPLPPRARRRPAPRPPLQRVGAQQRAARRRPRAATIGIGIAGGGPGVNAMLEIEGEWTVVVMTNLDPPSAGEVARKVREMIEAVEVVEDLR